MSHQSVDDVRALGQIDLQIKAFLDAHPLPVPKYDNLLEYKQIAAQRSSMVAKALGDPPKEIKQSELHYRTRNGARVRAKLYQPTIQPKHKSPVIVMFHGSGFCIGSPDSEEQSCRNFVQAFGAICISVAYRLAPKFPFPYAVKDGWDALRWVTERAEVWGADLSCSSIVGGTSAGGNIAAVLAHLARDEPLAAPLTGQYLAIPAVLPPTVVPGKYKELYLSRDEHQDSPVLPKAAIDLFDSGYRADYDDSVLYPVFNHPRGHAGLPPALFQVDGMDPIRDDALIYERVLREESQIDTKLYVYPGLPHGHWAFFPSLKSSAKFRIEQSGRGRVVVGSHSGLQQSCDRRNRSYRPVS